MSPHILNVTDASVEAQVIHSTGLVLVDFWAPWCGPCKTLAPLLDELADDYQGQMLIAKIDADVNKVSGARFSVRALPTLILFEDGVECERMTGVASRSRLTGLIDKHLDA